MHNRKNNQKDPLCFKEAQLKILDQAYHQAGELVSEAFSLDFTNFKQWPVDLRHYPQLTHEEKIEGVLAQLFRYTRATVLKNIKPDYYRICLYDPNILLTIERENLDLAALLSYILTHEFIHVARFIKFMELFSLDPAKRDREETLVHNETRKLLKDSPLSTMPNIFKLYQDHLLPLDLY